MLSVRLRGTGDTASFMWSCGLFVGVVGCAYAWPWAGASVVKLLFCVRLQVVVNTQQSPLSIWVYTNIYCVLFIALCIAMLIACAQTVDNLWIQV